MFGNKSLSKEKKSRLIFYYYYYYLLPSFLPSLPPSLLPSPSFPKAHIVNRLLTIPSLVSGRFFRPNGTPEIINCVHIVSQPVGRKWKVENGREK